MLYLSSVLYLTGWPHIYPRAQYSHSHLTAFPLAAFIGFVAKNMSSFTARTCLDFQQHSPPALTGALRKHSKT